MPLREPPYIAVIFTARRRETDAEDGGAYAETAARMEQLARGQDGFFGMDSARGTDGSGITVSYWRDEDAVRRWREHAEHTLAREMGRERFYEHYELRVARVERQYEWTRAQAAERQRGKSPALKQRSSSAEKAREKPH